MDTTVKYAMRSGKAIGTLEIAKIMLEVNSNRQDIIERINQTLNELNEQEEVELGE
jgi:hypothetical protein